MLKLRLDENDWKNFISVYRRTHVTTTFVIWAVFPTILLLACWLIPGRQTGLLIVSLFCLLVATLLAIAWYARSCALLKGSRSVVISDMSLQVGEFEHPWIPKLSRAAIRSQDALTYLYVLTGIASIAGDKPYYWRKGRRPPVIIPLGAEHLKDVLAYLQSLQVELDATP